VRDSEIGPCGGNAIQIENSSNVNVWDSYIHPEGRNTIGCCDRNDGIFAVLSNKLHIQGNVIAYGETNISVQGVRDVRVIGNFLLNPLGPFPRGQHFQSWSSGSTRSANITLEHNYALSSYDPKYEFAPDIEDSINFGFTDGVLVQSNYVWGNDDESGCGIIADDSANSVQIRGNNLIETGQCAIGIASGTNHIVDGNRAYAHGLSAGGGNTSISVWKQYSAPCGPVQVSNNTAVVIRSTGALSSFWDGGGCGTVSLTGNIWDEEAIDALSPIEHTMPPPASIPPLAYSTQIRSPWTTP
jgi:hypothetical protein